MIRDFDPVDGEVARRRTWLPLLLVVFLAFLAGVAMMAWILANWDKAATLLGVAPAPAAGRPAPAPAITVEHEAPAAPTATRRSRSACSSIRR